MPKVRQTGAQREALPEGAEARRKGKSINANPYYPQSERPRYTAWRQGWLQQDNDIYMPEEWGEEAENE